MERFKSSRWLTMAIPIISGFFLGSQPANAQYANPNQVYGSVNQQMNQGMLTPGEAQDMMNRENNYNQRAARLLRNDGGVLTPQDAAKLQAEAAKDARADQRDLSNNAYRGTGVGGFFGNLFGIGGTAPLATPMATPYVGSPYVTSPYLNTVAPVYSAPVVTTPVVTSPVVTPVYTTPSYVNNNANWAAHRAAERERHQEWEARHGY